MRLVLLGEPLQLGTAMGLRRQDVGSLYGSLSGQAIHGWRICAGGRTLDGATGNMSIAMLNDSDQTANRP